MVSETTAYFTTVPYHHLYTNPDEGFCGSNDTKYLEQDQRNDLKIIRK